MKADVRITVLKRLYHKPWADVYKSHQDWQPCDVHREGQVFLVGKDKLDMPAGFCSWAWADIQKYVMALARGADFVGSTPGTYVTCCTDGYRPVIFAVERLAPGARQDGTAPSKTKDRQRE